MREVKYLLLKITGVITFCFLFLLIILIGVNHIYMDFLGLGYDELKILRQENVIYKEQIKNLTTEINKLHDELNDIYKQGNELRLMVDLEPLNENIKRAPIGGSILVPEITFTESEISKMLKKSDALLQQLRNQIVIQKQSYGEIISKYNYNKDFFASIPALKPMEGYYSTRGFGDRLHPVLGISKYHEGLDIINKVGTPVYASGNGIVEAAGYIGGGYGVTVVINHGYGYHSLYAHLSKVLVKEGQKVKRGEIIGKSGRSGLTSGPHLHYEVHYRGIRQNPINYFLDDVSPKEYVQKIFKKDKE